MECIDYNVVALSTSKYQTMHRLLNPNKFGWFSGFQYFFFFWVGNQDLFFFLRQRKSGSC